MCLNFQTFLIIGLSKLPVPAPSADNAGEAREEQRSWNHDDCPILVLESLLYKVTLVVTNMCLTIKYNF
jgi:hypothetical protein